MNNNSKLNIKKLIFIVLKIIIFFASVYFIYARIEHSNVNFIDVIESISIIYLFPIIILMFLNWFLEAIKWKLSANILEPLSFIKAIKGTFSGVTISSVLPNRTGDFLGKVLFLSEGNKKEGIPLALYGNYAQLVTTLLFGLLGMIVLIINPILIPHFSFKLLFGIASLLALFFSIYIYFKPELSVKWISKLKKATSLQLNNLNKLKLINLLSLSIGRYIMFLIQFWLAFRMFNVELSIVQLLSFIGIYYLLITFIPGLFLAKIGIRESVAIWLFAGVTNDLTIVSVTLLIWLINIAIPSIIGATIISSVGWKTIRA